jgi:hypothetical protein
VRVSQEDFEQALQYTPIVNNDYLNRFGTLRMVCENQGLETAVEVVHGSPLLSYQDKYGPDSVNPINQTTVEELNRLARIVNSKLDDLCISEEGQKGQEKLLFDVYKRVRAIVYNTNTAVQTTPLNEPLHSNT